MPAINLCRRATLPIIHIVDHLLLSLLEHPIVCICWLLIVGAGCRSRMDAAMRAPGSSRAGYQLDMKVRVSGA